MFTISLIDFNVESDDCCTTCC